MPNANREIKKWLVNYFCSMFTQKMRYMTLLPDGRAIASWYNPVKPTRLTAEECPYFHILEFKGDTHQLVKAHFPVLFSQAITLKMDIFKRTLKNGKFDELSYIQNGDAVTAKRGEVETIIGVTINPTDLKLLMLELKPFEFNEEFLQRQSHVSKVEIRLKSRADKKHNMHLVHESKAITVFQSLIYGENIVDEWRYKNLVKDSEFIHTVESYIDKRGIVVTRVMFKDQYVTVMSINARNILFALG